MPGRNRLAQTLLAVIVPMILAVAVQANTFPRPNPMQFDPVAVGDHADLTLTGNNGTNGSVIAFKIESGNVNDFEIVEDHYSFVQPTSVRTAVIRFKPTARGTRTALLRIRHVRFGTINFDHTEYVTLTGDGVGITVKLVDASDHPITEITPSILSYSRQGPDPKHQSMAKVLINSAPKTSIKAYVRPVELTGGHKHASTAGAKRVHGWLETTELADTALFQTVKDNPDYEAGATEYSDYESGLPVTTDDKGKATLYYYASELGGAEEIEASTVNADVNLRDWEMKTLTLRFPFLQALPADSMFNPIGGTTAHPDSESHYGTPDMIKALTALAINYLAETGRPLPVNDMALPNGGLLDIGPYYANGDPSGYFFWKPPHIGHRRGDEADVGNANTGLLPGNAAFDTILKEQGWWVINPAFWKAEGNHYHLNFAYPNDPNVIKTGGYVNGKVSIREAKRPPAEPVNPETSWADQARTQLDVKLWLTNRGGLEANAVTMTGVQVQALSRSASRPTLTSALPIAYGSMPIRQQVSRSFRLQFASPPPVGAAFLLTITGTATAPNDARSFPFDAEVIMVVP